MKKASTDRNWLWKPGKADRRAISHGDKVVREAQKAAAERYRKL